MGVETLKQELDILTVATLFQYIIVESKRELSTIE